MPDRRFTIREMCEDFAVTPRTLRYYEYIELLAPERDGTRRLYSNRDRGRLTLILRGRRFGFPLEAIRQWLLLHDEGAAHRQAEVFLANAETRIAELEAERTAIAARIAELGRLADETRAWLAANPGPPPGSG